MRAQRKRAASGSGYREGKQGETKMANTKLKELILYIAQKCWRDESYGSVVLNKILFFADFRAYASYGEAITGQKYRRYAQGPCPSQMKYVKQELEKSGDAKEAHVLRDGFIQKPLMPLREPNLKLFSGAEIAIVDDMIEYVRGHSATSISNLSHKFAGWQLAQDRGEIPYYTVYANLESEELSDTEYDWATSVACDYAAA